MSMDALPVTVITPPAYYENSDQHNDCFVTRVAYDLGSTSTKVVVARVNICTKTIANIISEHTYSVPFFDDVVGSDKFLFSEWMTAYSLEMLQNAKMQADLDIISVPTLIAPRTEECAVATQAFRLAANGSEFSSEIGEKLGLPITVISQEEEGKLAYMSVLSQWQALNRQLPVVWDVGGASAQLTFKDEVGEFYSVGSDMASRSFQNEVLKQVCHKPLSSSPQPMSEDHIQLAIRLARNSFIQDSPANNMIRQRIAHHAPIVGIGKVHNLCALTWVHQSIASKNQGYSQVDLLNAIHFLANKSDDEMKQLAPDIPEAYIPNQLTNLILLYATMEKWGIDWVEVLDVNNAWGLLITGCH